MSRLSFSDAAERIKSSLDIVDVIQRTVILKKSGRNYMGKCPFHNDKNPSMNVSREKGIFKCFSCGVGGDTLTFLMRLHNRTYGEMIRELAQDQGIDIIEEGRDPEAVTRQRDARQKILDLNGAADQWFQAQLNQPEAASVMQYLSGRYRDTDTLKTAIERFHLGYAPAGWENLTPMLKNKFDFVQANPDLLVTAGLSGNRDHGQGQYDRFRHRLIIPIQDEKGQVVAFGGRALINAQGEEDKPKYLNSPETIVYHKSNVLYGFNLAKDAIRERKAAVVMEGYFDVMSAHLAGITESVGSCGTAMTDSHLKLLTRFGAETVYLAFDSDEAGLKAALSAIQLIEPYMDSANLQLKVLIVPDGKDPDDFIRANGGEAFRALMRNARHFLNFKLDMALKDLSLDTSEGRIQAANRLVPLLSAIQRATVRSEYLKQYAEKIGVSEEAIALEIKRYEQSQSPPQTAFHNQLRKKAISHDPRTSLKRNQPMLTDNLSELRSKLSSRQHAVEKNLLHLTLYNPESYTTMMRLIDKGYNLQLGDPLHQEILDGLYGLWQNTDSTKIDLMADSFPGTLLEKMNQLYQDKADVLHTFAELVLTAEHFCDSLGLGELKGPNFREKIERLAEEQVTQLARCRRMEQLQLLKATALRNEGEQIELTYQFQDRLTETKQPIEFRQAGPPGLQAPPA